MPLPAPPPRARRALLAAPRPLRCAQDTTSRGVRIGLTYDPGTKPGVVVLPVSGARGDSIRAILQRDLDFGDRVNAIVLERQRRAGRRARVGGRTGRCSPRLGAAAAVQVTPTPAGLHVAVYNVATKQTALVQDFPATAAPDSRAWRAAVHGIADELEEAFTGVRGIARTRIAVRARPAASGSWTATARARCRSPTPARRCRRRGIRAAA